jgi:transmembrane sensor
MEANQFREILHKIKHNTASAEEKALMESWYLHYNRNKQLDLSASDIEQAGAEMWARLNDSVLTHKVRPMWQRIAVAASIFVCIGLGTYFLIMHGHKQPATPLAVNNKIPPGTNKAILTLANGQQITLTDASNGTIAQQSNTVIRKTASGRIEYVGSGGPAAYNTTATPRGGRFELTLADGTRVTLDASSSVKYPVAFNGKDRIVEVTGQAYFEIANNPSRPFKVVTKKGNIIVLGTHFNVNAYDDEPAIKTTLLQGKVKVVYLDQEALLAPGQQAAISKDGHAIKVTGTDTASSVAWKNGMFRFEKTDLQTVMRQISRWYNVDIVYAGKFNGDDFFEGSTPRSTDVETILKRLEITGDVRFMIEFNKIVVKNK